MQTYLLLFRINYNTIADVTSEEMESRNKDWMTWIDSIAAQNKLVGGNHLDSNGRIINSNGTVDDGTFTENSTSVFGYILIQAESYEGAVTIAQTCPILGGDGNSVEVRALHTL